VLQSPEDIIEQVATTFQVSRTLKVDLSNESTKEDGRTTADIARYYLDEPTLSPRELAVRFTDTEKYFVSEASAYMILKAHDLITSAVFIVMKASDEFKDKTTAPNQLWQTDFTYLKVTGWGWFYLSSVLDDFSRYIVAWKLCTTMKASDVTDTLTMALEASGLDTVNVFHRPRLLSDNGSSYIAGDLADWLEDQGMDHVRGAPLHPQTQGKIERWHQTLKNRILLENYYLPGDLEHKISDFAAYYNHLRYHESIANLTPADVYFGRGQTILLDRERIKRDTFKTRRLHHRGMLHNIEPDAPDPLFDLAAINLKLSDDGHERA
jgi:putative transposase